MKGTLERFGFFGIVFVVCFVFSRPLSAATLQVEAQGSMLEIVADGVPLADILAAISARTGLEIKTDEPLTEAVTCRFTGVTVEQGVMQLMKNRSYALLFAETKGATPAPPRLWILPSDSTEELISPDGRANVRRKEWLAREFEDPAQLSRQFSAVPSGTRTEAKGIVITSLTPDSVLEKIGIGQGDLVSRVNENPTGTAEEFIRALQSVREKDSTIIMIERRRPDGRLDPVYVHFE